MAMPFMRAASNTEVPAGTRTDWPSIVRSSKPGGVGVGVIARESWANADALGFASASCGGEANSAGALAVKNVRIDFGAKVFEHGLNGRGHDLAEAADRSEAHGLREVVEQREIGAILRFGDGALRPAREQVDHFLRADAARDAFAAGFVPIKTHGVEGHVEHAGRVVANDDGAGSEHRTGFGEGFEVKIDVDHRGGKKSGGRARGRKGFQLATAADATRAIEKDLAHRGAHGHFLKARAHAVSPDADKIQAAPAVAA